MERGDPDTDGADQAGDAGRDGGGWGVIESESHLDLLSVGDGSRLAQGPGLCPKGTPNNQQKKRR